jgi:SulP family sulfate permease
MAITNQIRFDNLRGDVFGGITAAIVSLPLALAFGVASGAGPIAGLYGAVCVGFLAALFGGTPTLISEPTELMTVSPVYRFLCCTSAVGVKGITLF